MRDLITFLALALTLAVSPAAAETPPPAGKTEETLIALQHAWAEARVKCDVAYLEQFYANDFRVQNVAGKVQSRAEDIALFANKVIQAEYIRDEDMEVTDYGHIAVVTGVENLKGTYAGNPGAMALRFTNVYAWRDGRWQLTLHHGTLIDQP